MFQQLGSRPSNLHLQNKFWGSHEVYLLELSHPCDTASSCSFWFGPMFGARTHSLWDSLAWILEPGHPCPVWDFPMENIWAGAPHWVGQDGLRAVLLSDTLPTWSSVLALLVMSDTRSHRCGPEAHPAAPAPWPVYRHKSSSISCTPLSLPVSWHEIPERAVIILHNLMVNIILFILHNT